MLVLQMLQGESSTSCERGPLGGKLPNAAAFNEFLMIAFSLFGTAILMWTSGASVHFCQCLKYVGIVSRKEINSDLVVPTALLRRRDFPGYYNRGRTTREQWKVSVWAAKTNTALELIFRRGDGSTPAKQLWLTFTFMSHARFFFPIKQHKNSWGEKNTHFQHTKLRVLTLLSKWCLSLQFTVY